MNLMLPALNSNHLFRLKLRSHQHTACLRPWPCSLHGPGVLDDLPCRLALPSTPGSLSLRCSQRLEPVYILPKREMFHYPHCHHLVQRDVNSLAIQPCANCSHLSRCTLCTTFEQKYAGFACAQFVLDALCPCTDLWLSL